MKKKLFGSLGEKLKGNTLVAVLIIGVLAAGGFSYYTINDINQKLKEQQPNQITNTPNPSGEEEVEDTQKEQENVPLPKPSPSPEIKPEDEETDTEPETAVPVESGFILPIEGGKIYNAFSGNELVYNRTMDDWRTHNGVDISGSKDSAVRAGASGTVADIYTDGMLGTVVEINHGDFTARYCGLSPKTFVKKGDPVTQGQSIGSLGEVTLELSEESHLHLEILKNGATVNPDTVLG